MDLKFYQKITDKIFAWKNKAKPITDSESKKVMLREVIKKYLPEDIAIGNGFIINAKEEKSTQIDILIYHVSTAIVSYEGNLVCINSDAVLGVINVESKIDCKEELVSCLEKLADISELFYEKGILEYQGKGGGFDYPTSPNDYTFPVFVGLFSFEPGFDDSNFVLKTLRSIIEPKKPRVVSHVCLGNDQFYHYWLKDFYAYSFTGKTRNVASGYFITNLLSMFFPRPGKFEGYLWFQKERYISFYYKLNIPLHTFSISAVTNKDMVFVENNVKELVRMDKENDRFFTVFNQTILSNELEMVKLFVENGADVDFAINAFPSPFDQAIRARNNEVAKFLIDNAKDILNKKHHWLERAGFHKNEEIAEYLIKKGVLKNIPDKNKEFSLHLAAKADSLKGCELLLHDIEINKVDEEGNTPIFYAVHNNNEDIFRLFVQAGAKLHEKNNNNETLLHIASLVGNSKIIKKLVKEAIDINAKDNFGMSPLCNALIFEHTEVSDMLIKEGARINNGFPFKEIRDHYLKIAVCLSEVIGIPTEEINYFASLDDFQINDIDFIDFIMEMEEVFNTSIPDEGLEFLDPGKLTIRDLVSYLIFRE